ncbi:MAG: HAMP domain-containing sensor histidine kinase [Paracoccaceae bacterium]|nr:HAMP domain-containing sensor histidine kinase [Paracoccaceae bacterium]
MAGRFTDRARWLRRSSTLRLSLILSTVFVIAMAGAIFAALVVGENVLERRVDRTLAVLAQTANLEDGRGDSFSLILRSSDDLGDLPRPFAQTVRRGGGTVDLEREFRRAESWRVLVTEDSRGTPVFVAVPLDDSEETLELLAGILWTTVLVVAGLAIAIGLGTGLLARRRLARINVTLERLAKGDLAARTGHTRSRDDLDDIARQLDRTAGELERLVAQTRHLSASLAHDLRTPLARLRAQLEILPEGEARGAALEEAGRLSDIFDTIMRVARIEAGQGQDGFEPVDLGALAEELSEIFGPVIEDGGAALTLEISKTTTVTADRQMLVQAMANLIQNGLVHGGDQITLFAKGHIIGVADNGPGVDPAQFAEIVKPMVRLDAARTRAGTGLGLALVRAVADRHGAALDLTKNTPQGLRISLNFAKL